ncbi:MAG: hypothetical protein IT388_11210 [Nitrospirales bacterium]|nr:hypothetical protein [Nitrospirales bacterium]
MKKSRAVSLLLLLCLAALSGCGGGGNSAPSGSTLTINPAEITTTDASSSTSWTTQFYTISLKNAEGQSLGNTKVTITFPYAVPSSYGVVQLYDGDTPVNSPLDVETDDFGVYYLRLDMQSGGGLSYSGDLEARSGDAFANSKITVSSTSGDTQGE